MSWHDFAALRRRRTYGAVAVTAIFASPLLLLLAGSLREPGDPPVVAPPLIPDDPGLTAYQQAITHGDLVRAAANSMIVAAVGVPLSLLVASLAGFALTQLPRRITSAVLGLSVLALMVPATALLLPRFVLFRTLHLTDTLVPLIAPALIATSPLYPLVYYLAFRAIPADSYDECRLADLTPMQTWRRMALPQVRPVTAGLAALTFVLTWSNLLDPMVYLYDRATFTLPLALRALAAMDPHNQPVFLAGAVLTTLPTLLVIGVAQRRFMHSYGPEGAS
ncbi:carbohydrate ABC transporter permease [Catellatospora sichuanensis]|uniref:carbohydrate ABC transporter permease n=1 Tax=Catellatospora sichuanensis TaxID=1969805 RepID=UPI001FE81578|nr:carbohydrate ABC transporter permease [Catellatospora sichuanensis]